MGVKVEPQGIEPWSREDHNRIFYMLSWLWLSGICRQATANAFRSYGILAAWCNVTQSSSAKRHRYISTCRTAHWAMMAPQFLIGVS